MKGDITREVGSRLVIIGLSALLVSCSPLAPPESASGSSEGKPLPRLPKPVSAEPEKSIGEPDWQARYRERREQLEGTFRSFPTNQPVRIRIKSGDEREGIITRIGKGDIDFKVTSGVITYPRGQLAVDTRCRLFEEDYLHVRASQEVFAEQKVYEAGLMDELVAAERSQSVEVASSPRSPPLRFWSGPPVNDPVDQSVWQVKTHLQHTLQDPDSIEYISWSPVMGEGNEYRVVCTYRARAGSFGVVTETRVFFLDVTGTVTSVSAVRSGPISL